MQDPYMQLLDEIRVLLKKELSNIAQRLDMIEEVIPKRETFGMKDTAKALGVSVRYVYDHPELLPNGGVSEFSGSKRWSHKTFHEWKENLREGKRGRKAFVQN